MNKVEWRFVPNFDKYMVSSLGDIKSLYNEKHIVLKRK